jgi:raffinose/stachyose/melibiose transport system substrate-binding protein
MNALKFQQPISRRHAMALLGAGAATTLLASCVGPGSGTATTAAAGGGSAFSGKATGTVSFYHWRGEDKATFATLIDRFQKKNPKITVNMTITTSNDYVANALPKVRGGGLGDVLPAFRGAQFEQFAEAGVFTPLTGQSVVDDYTPGLIEAGQSDKKQLGLPYQLLLIEPIFNEDVFDKANANPKPTTWDETLNACEKLKSKGFVPIAYPGADNGNSSQLLNSMVLADQPSEDAFTQIEAGKLKVTDDWFLAVLKKYQQLGQYFQPNFMGSSQASARQIFVNQQAGALSTGSYDIAPVRQAGGKFPIGMFFPNTLSSAKKDWYQGVYNATFILGVNSKSKVKPAALKFVEFLSEKTQAEYYANQTVQWLTL